MPLFILIGIGFIAWLMWSSKDQKETFLGIVWALMVVAGLLNLVWMLLVR